MCDSTNAETPGFTPPERTVGRSLDAIFAQAPGRIIVASFASHIHRMQQVIDKAYEHGRSVAVVGRSMTRNVNIAANLGYLTVPEGTLIRPQDIADAPRRPPGHPVHGQPGRAHVGARAHGFARPPAGRHPAGRHRGASRPSRCPATRRSVWRTVNRLFQAGANVIYESRAQVHVSGHAAAEELKMMLNLVRPNVLHARARRVSTPALPRRAGTVDGGARRPHLHPRERRRARTERRQRRGHRAGACRYDLRRRLGDRRFQRRGPARPARTSRTTAS